MEIEKKYLIDTLPETINQYEKAIIKQGYVSTDPVIRIRQKNKQYFLTVKSRGLLAREEFEIEIDDLQFQSLSNKVDYNLIHKERYFIPLKPYLIELDIFKGRLQGLILAEVEFPSIEEAYLFTPPKWFGKDVTEDGRYHNSQLCKLEGWKGGR